jgi:hypothetical protein
MIATGRRVVLGDFFREEDFFFLSWARRSSRRGNALNALEIKWGGYPRSCKRCEKRDAVC